MIIKPKSFIYHITAGLALLFFVKCVNGKHTSKDVADTIKQQDSTKQHSIDSLMALGNRPENEELPPSQAEERKRLETTYDNIRVMDSTFDNGKERISLRVKYYCLKDSDIVIPKKYDLEKKPTEFVTHPFVSDVLLINGNDTVLNKQFTAKDFNPFFEDPFAGALKKYGSLLEPVISRRNAPDNLILSYSLSISVTDLGIPARIIIQKNGNYKIEAGY